MWRTPRLTQLRWYLEQENQQEKAENISVARVHALAVLHRATRTRVFGTRIDAEFRRERAMRTRDGAQRI